MVAQYSQDDHDIIRPDRWAKEICARSLGLLSAQSLRTICGLIGCSDRQINHKE
jgi:hypothetical protein